MKILLSMFLVLVATSTYAVDERFLGGAYDGHALARLITYGTPPELTVRYRGGALDGNAFSRLILYGIPANAKDRFRGGSRDGHARYNLNLFDAAIAFGRFKGGPFDGFQSSTAGPFANPLNLDIDGDGLPDGWESAYFGNLTGAVIGVDQDGDGVSTREEFTADTNPNDPTSYWKIRSVSSSGTTKVFFVSSSIRSYDLEYANSLISGGWSVYPGQSNHTGIGGLDSLSDNAGTGRFYRVRVFGP